MIEGTERAYEATRAYAQRSRRVALSPRRLRRRQDAPGGGGGDSVRHGPRNSNVLFAVVPDLLDHLRATFDPGSGVAYDERFNAIRSAFLLILDDLGTENTTPWAREKLYQLINHRYNEQLPTIITSNQEYKLIDERILSRLLTRT